MGFAEDRGSSTFDMGFGFRELSTARAIVVNREWPGARATGHSQYQALIAVAILITAIVVSAIIIL